MDKYVKLKDVPKGKRWEHYWNYYKIHTIIGGFLLVMGVMLIKDVFFREKVDLVITVASTGYFSEEASQELERCLNEYARDYNGNGHKLVEMYDVTLSTDVNADPQVVMANQTRLLAQFQNTDAAILLMDEEIYEYLGPDEEENLYAGMVDLVGEEAAPLIREDRRRIYLKDLPALQDNEYIQRLPDLFFVIRDESNVNRKNKPEISETYQNSVDFLRNMVRNEVDSADANS
ncbi:MAG: hypothetical protein HFE44_04530 [Oscillospiraceae bacterium]|jgi:hypothetical protein|nr:hypothetical protein [Oscillospiraceae bacterium]